jgi:hypothetical protein
VARSRRPDAGGEGEEFGGYAGSEAVVSTGYDSGVRQIRHGDLDIHLRNRDHHHHDATPTRPKAANKTAGNRAAERACYAAGRD